MKIDLSRYTVGLCCSAMMCLAISVNLPPIFLTTFGETFGGSGGLSSEQLGRIPATIFTAMVIGILFAGPLADRMGAKVFSVLGLGFLALGLAVLGLAPSFTLLLLAGIFLGLGVSCLEVVLSPIVAAARPGQRTSALNKLHLFYSIGAVVTVLIGSAALHLQVSWRMVCLTILVFPALVLVCFVFIHTPPIVQNNEKRTPLRSLIQKPFMLAAALAIFLGGATEIGIAQWLPAYTERGLGYSKATSGMALAVFSVSMGIGRFTATRIVRSMGTIPLMISCCLATVVLLVVGCFCPFAPVSLFACMLTGFSVSCLWPSTLAIAADRFPRGGASMFALLAASGNAGCTLMPWLIGLTAEYSSLRLGVFSAAVCPVLMALLLIQMKKHPS